MINIYIGQTRIIQTFFSSRAGFQLELSGWLPQLSTKLCQDKQSQCSMLEKGTTPSLQGSLPCSSKSPSTPWWSWSPAQTLTFLPAELLQMPCSQSLQNPTCQGPIRTEDCLSTTPILQSPVHCSPSLRVPGKGLSGQKRTGGCG